MHSASPLAGVSQCCFIACGHVKTKNSTAVWIPNLDVSHVTPDTPHPPLIPSGFSSFLLCPPCFILTHPYITFLFFASQKTFVASVPPPSHLFLFTIPVYCSCVCLNVKDEYFLFICLGSFWDQPKMTLYYVKLHQHLTKKHLKWEPHCHAVSCIISHDTRVLYRHTCTCLIWNQPPITCLLSSIHRSARLCASDAESSC